ncbi:MAG: DUF4124 domain-containing protein [Gammaproteobacteria bacterium]|nr:DUF4124 domain-containing protein [Gammaproteobacteria bacterium]
MSELPWMPAGSLMVRRGPLDYRLPLLTLALVVTMHDARSAEVYRWVDENGTVTYSSTKPQGRDIQQLEIRPERSTPAAPVSTRDLVAAADKARQQRLDRAQEQAAQLAAAAEREQLCSRARANLAGLETSTRVFHVDQSGARIRIDEQQRQEDIAKLRAIAETNCK